MAETASEAVPFARAKTPSGPRGHLLLGVLPRVRKDPLGTLDEIGRSYPDVARYRLGPMTSHLVTHPDGVRRILQDNVANYTKDHLSYGMARWILGNGLVTSEGSYWLRQRRLAQPAFHRQKIAALGMHMCRAARDRAERWASRAGQSAPLDVVHELMELTLSIVGQALLGSDVQAQSDQVGVALNVISAQFVERFRTFRILPPVLPTRMDRAFRAAIGTFDTIVYEIIAERRRNPSDRGDLLSMFIGARDADTGEQMNDKQLRDEVLTMLTAGHETTATALSWVFVLLEQHPEIERRLHAELDEVLAGRDPSTEDLPRLTYTRMVIDETLRLYPPVYILSRKVVADDVICGYRIPGGTSVDISPLLTHRHPEFWEDPEVFRPERFTPEESARRPKYAYFPFLGGPRQCIGNAFALMEAQLILATLAQRYRLRTPAGHRVIPDPLVTLRPKGGLPMTVEARGFAGTSARA